MGSTPIARFDKETHDFGKVRVGKTVTDEFTLTNQGDAPLAIKALRTSCGCTKAVHGSREVAPHGKTGIACFLDTTGMRAGRVAKTIFVESNDPQRPTIRLTLIADVVRDLTVEPPSLAKELTGYTESVSFPLRVKNASDRPYAITAATTDSHGVTPVLRPDQTLISARSEASFTLELKLERDPSRIFYSGRIALVTDNPLEPALHLRYLVTLKTGR